MGFLKPTFWWSTKGSLITERERVLTEQWNEFRERERELEALGVCGCVKTWFDGSMEHGVKQRVEALFVGDRCLCHKHCALI